MSAQAQSASKKDDKSKDNVGQRQPPAGVAPPLSPGPAYYNHSALIGQTVPNIRKAPSYSMVGRGKEWKLTDIPGPGAYESKTVLGDGVPKFSIRARTNVPKSEMLIGGAKHGIVAPGPGAYSVPEPQRKKITMFPKARDPAPPQYPGPQYEVNNYKTTSVKIGKEVRGTTVPGHKKEKRPDPGTYNLPGLMGSEGRKPNLKGGRDSHKVQLTPGPGAYTPAYAEKKGWTMGARHKLSETTYVSSTNPLGEVKTVIFDEEAAMS
jgi:hypothetical protein